MCFLYGKGEYSWGYKTIINFRQKKAIQFSLKSEENIKHHLCKTWDTVRQYFKGPFHVFIITNISVSEGDTEKETRIRMFFIISH